VKLVGLNPNIYSVLNVSPYPQNPHVAAADTNVQPMALGLRRKRKAQVSCVLTSSSYKNELLAKVSTGPKAKIAVVRPTTRNNNNRRRKGSGPDFDLSKKAGSKPLRILKLCQHKHTFTARNCATIIIFRKIGLSVSNASNGVLKHVRILNVERRH